MLKHLCVLTSLLAVCALAVAADAPLPAPTATTPTTLTGEELKGHLGHVIDWYRRTSGVEPAPAIANDDATRDRLRQAALTELRIAFEFGRAAANFVIETTDAPAQTGTSELSVDGDDPARYARIAAGLTTRIAQQRAQLAALDARIKGTKTRAERTALNAQRERLVATLNLTREVQTTAQGLQEFAANSNSSASGETGLLGEISDMERQVPEARTVAPGTRGATATPAPAATAAARADPIASAKSLDPKSAGLIALTTEWLSLRTVQRQHTFLIDGTDELSQALDAIRRSVSAQVRDLLRPALSGAAGGTGAGTSPADLEQTTTRFRQLSTLLVPLGEEGITLDTARGILLERRAALETRAAVIARLLAVRVGILIAILAFIVAVSALWRRATFRYLHDARRRRQFLALRRVTTGVALTVVVLIAFLSEIGSLATYIGFLTAGIAVALQNVILAVVAYFFLIGRYGVRVGDRITMAGVTGRVADIGLIRIYLTELAGPELQSTGRMIVLSNAVLFQPSALFKQIPGADYAWHTVTLAIDPAADVEVARNRFRDTSDKVYETYRASIERQFASARHLVDFESSPPSPEVTARFSERGLEMSVRYPVELEHAAAIDQHMARALRESLDQEPRWHWPARLQRRRGQPRARSALPIDSHSLSKYGFLSISKIGMSSL